MLWFVFEHLCWAGDVSTQPTPIHHHPTFSIHAFSSQFFLTITLVIPEYNLSHSTTSPTRTPSIGKREASHIYDKYPALQLCDKTLDCDKFLQHYNKRVYTWKQGADCGVSIIITGQIWVTFEKCSHVMLLQVNKCQLRKCVHDLSFTGARAIHSSTVSIVF